MPTVYLIHLDRPLKRAKHYLGYSALESVKDRLARHKAGYGARLLAACNEQGIDYHIVRIWECTTTRTAKQLERSLKKRHDTPNLCPICNPKNAKYRVDIDVEGIDPDCNRGIPF